MYWTKKEQEEPVRIGGWPPISIHTNIHLDQSSLLRKQWSPFHWFPPSGEVTSTGFGHGWATCLGVGASLPWQPNKVGSSIDEWPWLVCPLSNQWMLVPCNQGWAMLVLVILRSLRCPIMVENMPEGRPHWTLDACQGRVECWAQKNCYPQPWW